MRRLTVIAALGLTLLLSELPRCSGPASGAEVIPPPGIAGGKFAISCHYSHSAQVDPIVSPGVPSAHLHDFFGNTTTGADSTPASLVGGPTTCRLSKDSAAYWAPAAYRTDTGKRIMPRKVFAYYFGTPGVTEVHLPAGLAMLSGNPHATSPAEATNIAFSCGNGHRRTHSPVKPYPYNCKTDPDVQHSEGVVAIVKFPFCWDGTGLQPGDVTFPDSTGDCPAARLVQLQMRVHYGAGPSHPGFQRGDLLTFSSGPWWTLHADFMNGWVQRKLDALVDGCQNAPNLNCGFLTDTNRGPGA
jgi:hypothetical protein